MNLPVVDYTILFNKSDVTADVSPFVLSIQYTDKVTDESDTVEITVEDSDGRWQNDWYPVKGDSVQLFIRDNGRSLDCGVFQVDEIAFNISNNGDVCVIKGLAAGIKTQLRTKRSYAHEDKSLQEIASTVAVKLGLKLIGTVPDIRISRVNQYRETDLAFLNRLGAEYGCIFSVRNDMLVFVYYPAIETKDAVFKLFRKEIISFDYRDQSHKTFKKARVKHHNPYKKQTISYFEDSNTDNTTAADDLEIRSKVDNRQQAEAKGKYALFKSNTKGAGGDITLPGNLLFISGNNFEYSGSGKLNGTYHILESTHTITRDGGYLCAGNVKRVKE